MKKILISILGKGVRTTEGVFDYQTTTYRLEDGLQKETKLVSDLLQEAINPDTVYIVGTDQSLWHVADQYLKDYQKILIPYGLNKDEFWEMFEAFTKLDVKDKEIYIDITHGFRSIPLFISTILTYFENTQNAKVSGVYYGIFEAKVNNITPVVNMLPLLELNSWINATNIFKEYGDGRKVAQLLKDSFKKIPNYQKRQYAFIQNLEKNLITYSKAVGFSAVKIYLEKLQNISDTIKDRIVLHNFSPALDYIIDTFEYETSLFQPELSWQNFLTASELFYNKNRYAQSLTILRETIHVYVALQLEYKITDLKKLEGPISFSLGLKNKEREKFYTKEFIKLSDQIKELRNSTNHAFLNKNATEKMLINSIENLASYIRKLESILENGNAIKDLNALKNYIAMQLEK